MTATQSPLSPSLSTSTPDRRADPSMEEILASIRKIIAEDDQPASRPAPAIPVPRREVEETRLAAVVTPITPNVVPARPAVSPFGSFRPIPPVAPPVAEAMREVAPVEATAPAHVSPTHVPPPRIEPEAAPMSVPEPVAASPAVEPFAEDRPSENSVRPVAPPARQSSVDTGALVSAATTESIASAFQALTTSVALTNSETIDRHVRELLRPMLREWLDAKLPGIVETMVAREIARISGRE